VRFKNELKLYLSRITDATVDTSATCDFNFRIRKYAQCGPRLIAFILTYYLAVCYLALIVLYYYNIILLYHYVVWL